MNRVRRLNKVYHVPGQGYPINMFFAANDTPDLIRTYNADQIERLSERRELTDLMPYLNTLNLPNLHSFLGTYLWDNLDPVRGTLYSIVVPYPSNFAEFTYFAIPAYIQKAKDALRFLDLLSRPENRHYLAVIP